MSATELTINPVQPEDLPTLMQALRMLAKELDDPFRATQEIMAEALFGAQSFAFALLARHNNQVFGATLATPVVSTIGGSRILYVSDLWVAESARRQAVGRRLLAAAVSEGAARWQTDMLKLTVYIDNDAALAFYKRLGFELQKNDRSMILDRSNTAAL